jgi:hypothetical protein
MLYHFHHFHPFLYQFSFTTNLGGFMALLVIVVAIILIVALSKK